MRAIKKLTCVMLSASLLVTGCGAAKSTENSAGTGNTAKTAESTVTQEISGAAENAIETSLSRIDNAKWNYQEEDDVYWQVGISYCENPAAEEYETLGVFVPGAYMTAKDNGNGTYTCEVNWEAAVGSYTAETAPIVLPVNTPGYSAMAAPTGYVNGVSSYTDEGFIYVSAGCRGRDAGAPAGVTDLKAAIRYVRYNEGTIPGSMESIFSFGMSGGGAQSALLGATGDSELYTPYLEAIGAVKGVSDAVAGSMCWCPITNLDYANEAYEWNMGVTRSDLDEETQQLSDGLAEAYALYINELGLTDEEGNVLTLTASEEGIYQDGSYYEYLKNVIEESLNHFLQDTTFPYDASASSGMGMMGIMGGDKPADLPEGGFDGFGGNAPEGKTPEGTAPTGNVSEGAASEEVDSDKIILAGISEEMVLAGGFAGNGGTRPEGTPDGTMPSGGFGENGGTPPEGAPDGTMPSGGFGENGGTPPEGMPEGTAPEGAPEGGMPDGTIPEGTMPEGAIPEGTKPDGAAPDMPAGNQYQDNINRNAVSGGITLSGTYETVQDYIDALNAETIWVTYDSTTNTASITSIADFVKACKNASKNVGAFDDLDATQGENELFGYGDGSGAHFDAVMAELLQDNETYAEAYASDLEKTDALGNTVEYRMNMYNPMYYLDDYYEGYQTANVAQYWRIRSGINQGDTALCTEVNLALALEEYGAEVDFETVWGQGHTQAERTGDSTSNFIEWVKECLK